MNANTLDARTTGATVVLALPLLVLAIAVSVPTALTAAQTAHARHAPAAAADSKILISAAAVTVASTVPNRGLVASVGVERKIFTVTRSWLVDRAVNMSAPTFTVLICGALSLKFQTVVYTVLFSNNRKTLPKEVAGPSSTPGSTVNPLA